MEEVDKGCLMIRMGVSGWMFHLVPANWVVPDQRPLNSCVCVLSSKYAHKRNIDECSIYNKKRIQLPSVLWCCWFGSRKGIRPVKNWVVGCWRGYLSGARCRLACGQLMPLPLTVSCFSKIQIGLTFLVLAHPGSPGQRAVKRVCVCIVPDKGPLNVCVCACVCVCVCACVCVTSNALQHSIVWHRNSSISCSLASSFLWQLSSLHVRTFTAVCRLLRSSLSFVWNII